MRASLHNVQLSNKREAREVIIVEGCSECVEKFHVQLVALIAQAKEEARNNPCGCKEKDINTNGK
jgi:hypothetical protein